MKAVTYQGPNNVAVKEVPDAKLEKKDDIIVKIESSKKIWNGADYRSVWG